VSDAVARLPGPSSALLTLGALVAGFYVAAQLAQQVVFHFVLPDDLLAVGSWAAEFVATADPVQRDALLGRFRLWDGAVGALYLPLLAAHALSSAAFAVAVCAGKPDRWDRILAIALGANALRGLLRTLQMHAGIAALGPLNATLYLPVTLLTYGMLSAWLVRAALKRGSTSGS